MFFHLDAKSNPANICESCGKTFKGSRGVKIHQAKAKCCSPDSSNVLNYPLDPSNHESGPLERQESNHGALPHQLENELISLNSITTSLLSCGMSDLSIYFHVPNRSGGYIRVLAGKIAKNGNFAR